MRSNPVKEKLARGEHAFGTMVFEFTSPGLATILANAGAEYVLYDMEHTGIGLETLKAQVAHCRGLPIQPMVRVPLEFEGELEPVFKSIHNELMSVFKKEVAHFNDERYAGGIGFLPDSAPE